MSVRRDVQDSTVRQKQINTLLKADHPERPTITLGWSLEYPLGVLANIGFLLDVRVSRSGWHRNRGVFVCSRICSHIGRRRQEWPFTTIISSIISMSCIIIIISSTVTSMIIPIIINDGVMCWHIGRWLQEWHMLY